MNEPQIPVSSREADDPIFFAELSGGVVVIRVIGRGSFANSVELKTIADLLATRFGPGNYHFIIDLGQCSTMDSTFMGVIASIGLRQKRENSQPMSVVNANDQSTRLLQTLGLSHFIQVRSQGQTAPAVDDRQFLLAKHESISKAERIVHMIEAHENLCDIDTQNAVRFESVLKYLRESLEREKNR